VSITARLIACAAIAFAALALAPLPAAHADINCPAGMVDPSVSPDCYFLHMMAVDQIFTADTSQAD
jgi:hypothetical protein